MFKMSYRSLPLVLALLAAPLAAQDVVAEPKATAGKRRLSVAPIKFSAERHLVVPKLRYDGSHPITFEAIVSSLYRGSIMGDFNGSGLGLSVANGYCSFHVNDGREGNSGYATIKATKSIGRDKPVHVAGVFDGKELRLYVGGELQGGETIGEFNKSKHPFMIGADPGGGGEPTKYLHGNIDKVRISTTVRFKQSFTPPTAFESDDQTLVLYRFSERDGDFVSDASGNGRHAHIVSARKELVRPEAESPDLQTRVARLEKEVAQLKALLKIALKQRATDPQQVAIDRLRELGGKITVTDGKATKANLTNSAISDAEMELIGSLTSLQLLTLNGCRNLTDAGLVHLKPLTGLKGLALERTNITDAGLENLKGLKELTLLSLNWTRVGDAGLVHLQDMKKMGTLYLCATQTADAGVASF
ncbi:MAG: hypothetical protein QF805_30385, partial [Pirellulaceae bacterium]|nr:hypothetical protein [Pirellulaceae bacterium]